MGIIGMQSFLKKNSSAFEQVNLREITELYRKEMKRDPVMIIDVSSCVVFWASSNPKIKFMPAELKQFKENVEIFINKCCGLGIKMVVVLDGMLTDLRKNAWPDKKKKIVLGFEKFFSEEFSIPECSIIQHRGILTYIALQAFQSSDNCKVSRSLYEADSEIIAMTKKLQYFAILSNDSDFLMAEGVQYLLSAEDLDLESMTTYNYNRNRIAEYLRINPSLFPLFASLSFHTDVDSEILKKFYRKNKIDQRNRFMELAKFLRNFSLEEQVIENLLATKDVPGVNKKWLAGRIEYFSGCYAEKDLTLTGFPNWDEILFLAKKKFTSVEADKSIFELLLHKSIFFIPLGNFRKPSPGALQFIREKIYGILFFEYPYSKLYVTEHYFETLSEGAQPKYMVRNVSFYRRFHPGLLYLWSSDTSKKAEKERWKVFCRVINENLNPNDLKSKNIPEELLFPLLAAFLMRWESPKQITWTEVKTILIQSVIVSLSTSEEIKLYPEEIHKEAYELSAWLLVTLNQLYLLNSVCGNPFSDKKTSLVNFFDGKVFHDVWEKVNKNKNVSKQFSENVYRQYRDLVSAYFKLQVVCGYGDRNN